jgi:hypothetical protein
MKMNKAKTLIIMVLILSLSLASCSVYNEYYGHADVDEYWRYGTEGVEVSFLNENFVFYDGEYMQLQIMMQNKGAYDDPQGKVVLSGYDPNIIKITQGDIPLPDEFYGKNAYNDEGSVYFVEIQENNVLDLSLGDTYEATMQASVCYTYQTVATPTVCLLYDPEDEYLCDQDSVYMASQGGPMAVTSVDTTYLQDQVRFSVTIENVGDGTVLNAYDLDSYDACPFTLDRNDLNYVAVDMAINGLGEPSCVPNSQYVRLNDEGRGMIVCTFVLRGQESYTTPLEITLDYLYLSGASQELLVVERDVGLEQEVPDSSGGSGGSYGGGSGGGSGGSQQGECYCSDANMAAWGGCICLYINGQEHWCLEESTQIPIQGEIGDSLAYQVRGSPTVNTCGDGPSPQSGCPFDGYTTIGGAKTKLEIFGTTVEGGGVSERCTLVLG